MLRRAAHVTALLIACGLSACHDPDLGKSCLKDTDCPDSLECEVEHGKGTCQEHHDADDEAGDDSNDDDTNDDDTNGGPG